MTIASQTTQSLFSLAGREALVTGGTSGIGLMIARGLLIAGAEVWITGRSDATISAAIEELKPFGACRGIVADLGQPGGAETLAEAARVECPHLSILVNNAGITAHAPLGEYAEETWDDVFALNAKAPFLLTQALLELLQSNAEPGVPAQVINTGSVAALNHNTPDSWAYGPSKAALHHNTRVLAKRLAPQNIRMNCIAPGLFPSKMSAWITEDEQTLEATTKGIPAGRIGNPDDIASLIVYVASSSYLTGAVIPLDGGLSL